MHIIVAVIALTLYVGFWLVTRLAEEARYRRRLRNARRRQRERWTQRFPAPPPGRR